MISRKSVKDISTKLKRCTLIKRTGNIVWFYAIYGAELNKWWVKFCIFNFEWDLSLSTLCPLSSKTYLHWFQCGYDPMCSCSDSVCQLSRDALSERWETRGRQHGRVITRLRKVSHTSYVSLSNWPDANIIFILSLSRSISRSVWLQVSLRVIL